MAFWLTSGEIAWLAGTLLIFAVIPFTLIAILPTNNKLLDPNPDRRSDATRALLQKWARLHAVRSNPSLAASIVFLTSILFQ
jgi:uncharacterized membrane protein